MALPAPLRRSFVARQIGTLTLSRVGLPNPMALVRAAAWHNNLLRLGVSLPLFVIHDLGLLLCGQATVRAGDDALADEAGYQAFLRQVAESELSRAGHTLRLRDDLVSVLLCKLLGDVAARWPDRRAWVGAAELPLEPGLYSDAETVAHEVDFDLRPVRALRAHLVEHALYLLTAVEQIDLDTVRLLGLFRDGSGLLDLADLLNVFSSPEANSVVNFSMDLLPSVLEARRQSGVQTFSIDGYASIERQGSLDSVVLTELAYDDEIFAQKLLDNELFYYGHEKQRTEERRLQYLLVDSSASMRGEREVFARGLALTLAKKLSLLGNEVWLRFFDSRLYDVMRMGHAPDAVVPYLLCFRSERGRNYGRVFRQLLGELQRLRRQDPRQIVVHIITHGQCHIETTLVEQLREVAVLCGVFILPSSRLHLDYLSALQRYQIVEAEALSTRERSVGRALEIVDQASEQR